MKKSILDISTQNEIYNRLDKLAADTKPQWGKMNVTQMLRHLSMANRIPTGELDLGDRSNLFTRTIIRYVVLNGVIPPKKRLEKKPVQTFPEINVVKLNIPVGDINTERQLVKESLNKIINANSLAPRSPLIGKMTKENWGQNTYAHFNWHLTQFGV